MRGKSNKLGEGERKVRLGQDRLAIKNGNEWKLYTLFYPHPSPPERCFTWVDLNLTRKQ